MTNATMIVSVPLLHLNGTAPTELFEKVCEALGALRAAQAAIDEVSPNARDYAPETFPSALAAHNARQNQLTQVRRELEALAEGIADGIDERQSSIKDAK